MPRKPNYKFERMERDRAKAAKKAAKAKARAENTVPEGDDPQVEKSDDPEKVQPDD